MYNLPAYVSLYSHIYVSQFRFGEMVGIKCGAWKILIESRSWSEIYKNVRVC